MRGVNGFFQRQEDNRFREPTVQYSAIAATGLRPPLSFNDSFRVYLQGRREALNFEGWDSFSGLAANPQMMMAAGKVARRSPRTPTDAPRQSAQRR